MSVFASGDNDVPTCVSYEDLRAFAAVHPANVLVRWETAGRLHPSVLACMKVILFQHLYR